MISKWLATTKALLNIYITEFWNIYVIADNLQAYISMWSVHLKMSIQIPLGYVYSPNISWIISRMF